MRAIAVKVYTGTGDDGTTGLLYGGRVVKSADAPEAYGAVDEAVSALGLARAEAGVAGKEDALLLRLQRELFVVGAELATAPENRAKLTDGVSRVGVQMCEALKNDLDEHEKRLPELRDFVLPGENRFAAALDMARSVIRRAERRCVGLFAAGTLENPQLLQYLNRLSDLVFLMARDAEENIRTVREE